MEETRHAPSPLRAVSSTRQNKCSFCLPVLPHYHCRCSTGMFVCSRKRGKFARWFQLSNYERRSFPAFVCFDLIFFSLRTSALNFAPYFFPHVGYNVLGKKRLFTHEASFLRVPIIIPSFTFKT